MNTISKDRECRLLVCPKCDGKVKIDIEKYDNQKLAFNCPCGQRHDFLVSGGRIITLHKDSQVKPDSVHPDKKNVLAFTADEDGKSQLTCPSCGFEKRVSVPSNSSAENIYSVKCKCGQKFSCRFDLGSSQNDNKKKEAYFSFEDIRTDETEVKMIFLTDERGGKIICSECGFSQPIDPKEVPLLRRPFNFHCKCGSVKAYCVNTRKKYRKPTKLRGKYVNRKTSRKYNMMVEDISLSGIAILVDKDHDIRQGDILDLAFRLNDAAGTEMRNSAIVKRIDRQKIGCEFIIDQAYNKKLGFYLLK
jgi:transcription elongation factor Elf1